MKISEIREFTTTEIKERINNNENMLLKLKFTHSISPLDNPLRIKNIKKDIAKLKTELQQKIINNKNK